MPEAFDPYRKWLGIPPKDQPPNHYRLLAIELFEDDPDVIEAAADARMAHVRTYQTGQNSALSQKILNELSKAKLCLLDAARKTNYDAELRQRQAATSSAEPAISSSVGIAQASAVRPSQALPKARPSAVAGGTPVPQIRTSAPLAAGRSRVSRPAWVLPSMLAAGAVVLALGTWAVVRWSGTSVDEHRTGVAGGNTPAKSRGPRAAAKNTSIAAAAPSLQESVSPGDLPRLIENSIGMRLRYLPVGEFEMGLSDAEADAFSATDLVRQSLPNQVAVVRSRPRHRVRLGRPFYVGIHEVTVGQFRRFVEATGYRTTAETDGRGGMGRDASGNLERKAEYNWRENGLGEGDDLPVVNVSWDDAQVFCRWLSEREQAEYSLPTEAQWEYASRGGATGPWFFGPSPDPLASYAWCAANQTGKRQPVGGRQPNAFGLYDMYGNVWELCADTFAADYYSHSPETDPAGPPAGDQKIKRGGWYIDPPLCCNSAIRSGPVPRTETDDSTGFRVVRAATGPVMSATDGLSRDKPPSLPDLVRPEAKLSPPDEPAQTAAEHTLKQCYKTEWRRPAWHFSSATTAADAIRCLLVS